MTFEKISSNEMREMMNRIRCRSVLDSDRVRMMEMFKNLAIERDEGGKSGHDAAFMRALVNNDLPFIPTIKG